MIIGVLKEPDFENRVSILPAELPQLTKIGFTIWLEQDAGIKSFCTDSDYTEQGAEIKSKSDILAQADLIARINSLDSFKDVKKAIIISMLNPLSNKKAVTELQNLKLSSFSMDSVPRSTRAQSMDVLSSMATVAGYKAVLLAASHLPKFFPMFMTAAGSIVPAKVLILGAGVAGLQAIATAKRLGSVVEAFDVRSAVKEEVNSLGAKFVEVEGAKEDQTAGGYAVEQTEEFKQKQAQLIHDHAIKSDVIICTAQIPGRDAPVLIKKETVHLMKSGSVIVDLAASSGGNCELTKDDQTIVHNQVTIIGNSNLMSSLPIDSSKMYCKNLINFLKLLVKDGALVLDFDDDIVADTCITHDGKIINKRVKNLYERT